MNNFCYLVNNFLKPTFQLDIKLSGKKLIWYSTTNSLQSICDSRVRNNYHIALILLKNTKYKYSFVHINVYNIKTCFVYRLISYQGDIREYDTYKYVSVLLFDMNLI